VGLNPILVPTGPTLDTEYTAATPVYGTKVKRLESDHPDSIQAYATAFTLAMLEILLTHGDLTDPSLFTPRFCTDTSQHITVCPRSQRKAVLRRHSLADCWKARSAMITTKSSLPLTKAQISTPSMRYAYHGVGID